MGCSCSCPTNEGRGPNRSQFRRSTIYTFKTGRSTHAKATQRHGSVPAPHTNGDQGFPRRASEFNPFREILRRNSESTIAPIRELNSSPDGAKKEEEEAAHLPLPGSPDVVDLLPCGAFSSEESIEVLSMDEDHIANVAASPKRHSKKSAVSQQGNTDSCDADCPQKGFGLINPDCVVESDATICNDGGEVIDCSPATSRNRPMFMNGTNTRFTGHVASFRRTSFSSNSDESTPLASPLARPPSSLTARRRRVTFVSSTGSELPPTRMRHTTQVARSTTEKVIPTRRQVWSSEENL